MRSAPTLTLAVAAVASILARTRRYHAQAGEPREKATGTPTSHAGPGSAREARDEHHNSPHTTPSDHSGPTSLGFHCCPFEELCGLGGS